MRIRQNYSFLIDIKELRYIIADDILIPVIIKLLSLVINKSGKVFMGEYYSMTLVWMINCRFVFREWQSTTEVTFIIGCIVSLILAFLSMAMPKIRGKLEEILFSQNNNPSINEIYQEMGNLQALQRDSIRLSSKQLIVKKRVIPFFYSLFYSFLHVVIMLVMMSMNGYVILAIILGYTLGFLVFFEPYKSKKQSKCEKGCSK